MRAVSLRLFFKTKGNRLVSNPPQVRILMLLKPFLFRNDLSLRSLLHFYSETIYHCSHWCLYSISCTFCHGSPGLEPTDPVLHSCLLLLWHIRKSLLYASPILLLVGFPHSSFPQFHQVCRRWKIKLHDTTPWRSVSDYFHRRVSSTQIDLRSGQEPWTS